MNDQEFELQLSRTPLPEPPAEVRGRLLARARREQRWRTVERLWGRTLAAAAMLLLVLNLHFGRVHERQMIALVGPPSVERPMDAQLVLARFEQHQRLLLAWTTCNFPGDLREDGL